MSFAADERGKDGSGVAGAATADDGALVGQTFDDRFLMVRLIGVGGFGAVYAARDLQLGCGVAIKILRSDTADDERNLADFLNEVRRVTRLKHPNIVDWKTLAKTKDGVVYFVMELLEGHELEECLQREGKLTPARTARILLQILDALCAAHNLPDGDCLLHLDLKPSNVFLEPPISGRTDLDQVKVIDFGVSQYIQRDERAPQAVEAEATNDARDALRDVRNPGDTATLRLDAPNYSRCTACTPEYAAPEQGAHLLGDDAAPALDQRADLYSLGVIGFRMLTGRLPFERCANHEELLRRKLDIDPPLVASIAPRVPRALARFIDRCLRRDRDARFTTSKEAQQSLHRIVHRSTAIRSLAIGASAALVLLLSGWVMLPEPTAPRLELYESRDGKERLLTREVLYLGTARPQAALRVVGVRMQAGSRLRLVSDPTPTAPALDHWVAQRRDDTELLMLGHVREERVREAAYLEVVDAGETHYSEPFELAWLGADSVRLGSIGVPMQGERSIDPQGEELQIGVHAPGEDVDRIDVEHGSNSYAAQLDPARSTGQESVFVLPLSSLAAAAGPCDVQIHLVDRAGNEARDQCSIDVVDAPLRFSNVELQGAQVVGPRNLVHDLQRTTLSFELSNVANVQVSMIEDGPHPASRISFSRVQRGSVSLADLRKLDDDSSFAGRIELSAVDAPYVLRDDPARRGCATSRLTFACNPAHPMLSVSLSGKSGARIRPVTSDAPYFLASRDLEVHVTRENVVPVRIEVFPSSALDASSVSSKTLADPSEQSAVFDVTLQQSGRHELVVRCWKYLGEEISSRPPDLELRTVCVIDDTPPRLALLADDPIHDPPGSGVWPSSARILVFDAPNGQDTPPTPVRLRYDLERGPRSGSAVARRDIVATALPGETMTIELPVPGDPSTAAALADGRYVARLQPTDDAGNVGETVELPLEVDRNAPVLELTRPSAAVWQPDANGSYEVRVVADDANGVVGIVASVSAANASPVEFELASAESSTDSSYSEWAGRVRIPRAWMQREVEIRCEARDSRGLRASLATRRDAGSIEIPSPNRVRVQRHGAELGAMRLVLGNADAPYIFGGRSDDTEEKLFGSLGLASYNRLRLAKSWEVPIAAGAIGDFYLDEREATVAEFLCFVEDESGYADSGVWSRGSAPDEARRSRWLTVLRELPADQPVVDVEWDEADAFARWCGKRLPSFVEWEYALRGGPLYRACASGQPGNDVTEDTSISNLTAGVSEWSATPAATSLDASSGNPAAHANAHPLLFLAPWRISGASEASSFWVVGASSRHPRADFSVAEQRDRHWRGSDVGFRCAAPVADVLAVLELRDPDRPWFTEASEPRKCAIATQK